MDVFQNYKPIRNKIALLAVEDSLAVIWAYCQYKPIISAFLSKSRYRRRTLAKWETVSGQFGGYLSGTHDGLASDENIRLFPQVVGCARIG
jgi:hypothetical protein